MIDVFTLLYFTLLASNIELGTNQMLCYALICYQLIIHKVVFNLKYDIYSGGNEIFNSLNLNFLKILYIFFTRLAVSSLQVWGIVFQSVILNQIANHIPSNIYIHLHKISRNINIKDPPDSESPGEYVAVLGPERLCLCV